MADFSKIRQQKKFDEAVQFTIGERNLNNNSDSALEEGTIYSFNIIIIMIPKTAAHMTRLCSR